MDDRPGAAAMAMLVAKAAQALSENLEALMEIEKIMRNDGGSSA